MHDMAASSTRCVQTKCLLHHESASFVYRRKRIRRRDISPQSVRCTTRPRTWAGEQCGALNFHIVRSSVVYALQHCGSGNTLHSVLHLIPPHMTCTEATELGLACVAKLWTLLAMSRCGTIEWHPLLLVLRRLSGGVGGHAQT